MPTPTEHHATSRVLDVLDLLASADEQGYTLTEIAARIGAPKSSLFPILRTLCSRRFLACDPATNRYTIGLEAYAVGSAFLYGQPLLDHLHTEMRAVVVGCGETCQLGVRDKKDLLYIAKEDCSQPIQLISHVGKRLPLYATALGKALLLDAGPAELEALYPTSASLAALTDHTIVNREQLFRQLQEMRARGYATEYAEGADNVCCVAVPLRQNDRIVAALSVSMPIFRNVEGKEELVRDKLFEAQQHIETLLLQTDMAREFSRLLAQY